MKGALNRIKPEVENEIQGSKVYIYIFIFNFIQVLIFEPTHPRKNITLSITGVSDVIFKTKNYLIKKLDSVDFNFEKFQN